VTIFGYLKSNASSIELIIPLYDFNLVEYCLTIDILAVPSGDDIHLNLAISCCEALKALHAIGKIFCNVQPSAFLIRVGTIKDKPNVLLCDYFDMFVCEEIMAPARRQAKGRGKILPPEIRDDVFAFGKLLIFIATGLNLNDLRDIDKLSQLDNFHQNQIDDLRWTKIISNCMDSNQTIVMADVTMQLKDLQS